MWNSQTTRQIRLLTERPPETLDGVVGRLQWMNLALAGLDDSARSNPVRAFNAVYLRITEGVRDLARSGEFRDRDFMEALDVEFARLYFSALHSWTVDRSSAAAWAYLFELEHMGERHSDLEGAVLGVNAHINHDLRIALVRTNRLKPCPSPTATITRRRDYELINDLFKEAIDPVFDQLTAKLPGPKSVIWQIVDILSGPLDELIFHAAVVKCREMAWDLAQSDLQTRGHIEAQQHCFAAAAARALLSTQVL